MSFNLCTAGPFPTFCTFGPLMTFVPLVLKWPLYLWSFGILDILQLMQIHLEFSHLIFLSCTECHMITSQHFYDTIIAHTAIIGILSTIEVMQLSQRYVVQSSSPVYHLHIPKLSQLLPLPQATLRSHNCFYFYISPYGRILSLLYFIVSLFLYFKSVNIL